MCGDGEEEKESLHTLNLLGIFRLRVREREREGEIEGALQGTEQREELREERKGEREHAAEVGCSCYPGKYTSHSFCALNEVCVGVSVCVCELVLLYHSMSFVSAYCVCPSFPTIVVACFHHPPRRPEVFPSSLPLTHFSHSSLLSFSGSSQPPTHPQGC